MFSASEDTFWLSRSAWGHSLAEGLRAGAIVLFTVFGVGSLGWVFHLDTPFVDWLLNIANFAAILAAPLVPIFAIWTRWDIWINNRVKSKQ